MTANDLFTEQVMGFFDIFSDLLLNLVPIGTENLLSCCSSFCSNLEPLTKNL